MDTKDFQKIQDFFKLYTVKFHSNDPHFQKNIELKRAHSYRVWENSADLAKSIDLNKNDRLLIETAGLLHDIGRFEQFEKYGTFSDKKSVNHAWLSTEVIKKKGILDDLGEAEKDLILLTVYNHNKKEIPGDLADKARLFVNLIRDADKLDIWKIVTDYYCNSNEQTNNTLQLDLPDEPDINPINFTDLLNEKIVDLNNLNTLNDFKLLQIGWIYDLNFKRSFEMVKNKNYLEKIFESLPDIIEIEEIRQKVNKYIDSKINSDRKILS